MFHVLIPEDAAIDHAPCRKALAAFAPWRQSGVGEGAQACDKTRHATPH